MNFLRSFQIHKGPTSDIGTLTDRMIDQMKIWKTPPLFFPHQHPALTSMCGYHFNLLTIFNHFLQQLLIIY
jgi:hypothetical protein